MLWMSLYYLLGPINGWEWKIIGGGGRMVAHILGSAVLLWHVYLRIGYLRID